MPTEIEKITKLLQRSFEKGAWHGPAVKEVLQDITQETSSKRLPNTHSIIELAGHLTTWRNYVAKKLNGETAYTVPDEMNFPGITDWSKAMAGLEESQQNLLLALSKFPAEKLADLVQGVSHKYTYYTMLHGIIHHDLYHTGQIILIKKATAAQS
jgi:uncharacterized damage-inducible protein DinB